MFLLVRKLKNDRNASQPARSSLKKLTRTFKKEVCWALKPFHFITSAKREEKNRSSGMSESCFFWDNKSVGFRFYLTIWQSESWISLRYLEINSISLIYSLTYLRKKELLFWLARGLNLLTCVTCQIRGDSKLIAPLRPKVVCGMKNSYEIICT